MKRSLCTLIALVGLSACGNNAALLGLTLNARSSALDVSGGPATDANTPAVDAQGSAITVTSATLHVREVRLSLADEKCTAFPAGSFQNPVVCDGETVRVRGPFTFDLLSSSSIATLASVKLPALSFNAVDIKIDPSQGVDDQGESNDDDDGGRHMCATPNAGAPGSVGVAGSVGAAVGVGHKDGVDGDIDVSAGVQVGASHGKGHDPNVAHDPNDDRGPGHAQEPNEVHGPGDDPNDDHHPADPNACVLPRPRPHLEPGKTLQIAGTISSNGTVTPFVANLSVAEDLRFSLPTPVSVTAGTVASTALALDVSQWFARLPISACLASGDLKVSNGTLVLQNSTGACADLEAALAAGIAGSCKAHP
jgi:hypothetical protein